MNVEKHELIETKKKYKRWKEKRVGYRAFGPCWAVVAAWGKMMMGLTFKNLMRSNVGLRGLRPTWAQNFRNKDLGLRLYSAGLESHQRRERERERERDRWDAALLVPFVTDYGSGHWLFPWASSSEMRGSSIKLE